MIIKKMNEKQLLKIVKKYCLFFPLSTFIFIFIGVIIGEIYVSNSTLKEEKISVSILKNVETSNEIEIYVTYIKETIETMNKLNSFTNTRNELEKILNNISENKIQNINNLNKEIEKLNKILLESSEEMKLVIKNEIIYGKKKLFFMHTYKKDNIKSIIKSIVILSNIFGNFLLVWILFIIYGKRREKLR